MLDVKKVVTGDCMGVCLGMRIITRDVQTCYRVQHNRQVTVKFIENEFIEKFKRNPN